MEKAFKDAKNLIDRSKNILLTMHERMDGDDGGSVLALARHLEKQRKNITCVIKQGVPKALEFLPGSHKIQDDIYPVKSGETGPLEAEFNRVNHKNFDLLITFGCSNLARTDSEKIMNLAAPIINIDHHPDNEYFGDVNLVDPNKSSVAELVYDFFIYHRWPIDKEIATCLLTGIITDTGSFMHSNTEESTFKAAAQLMRKGAVVEKIVHHTYKNKSSTILKAWGMALENLHYDAKRKIIYSVLEEKDLKNLENLPQGAFEGLAETLNTYPEARFSMFLRQEGKIIKGSLRTDPLKNTDVSKIAKVFGGGGHKMAAGFSLSGKLVKDEHGRWRVI